MTFDEYVESLRIPARKKRMMRVVREEGDGFLPLRKHKNKKGFGKTERYPDFKHQRGIHPCSEAEKTYAGPAVKSVEQAVYRQLHQHVLKGIATDEKAEELFERLYRPGAMFLGLDVKRWESSMMTDVSAATEVPLFRHMLQRFPAECDYITSQMLGEHKIRYRKFKVRVKGVRMSGDLWTSLGNGFTNLMIVKFVCSKLGYDPVGVVEGDDGLFRLDGPAPTKEMFAELGFESKIEVFDDVGLAGFCKMKFDSARQHVTEPGERLAKLGWTTQLRASAATRRNLLYTKALSLKAEYPNCPVLAVFADTIIRLVRAEKFPLHLRFDEDRGWNASKVENAGRWLEQPAEILLETRKFYEQLYGVSVEQQLSIEEYFHSWQAIQPIQHPLVSAMMRDAWKVNWERFVTDSGSVDW